MRNFMALAEQDRRYLPQLREIQIEDLYRRARLPTLLFIPIVYMLYLVLRAAEAQRPAIAWIFVGIILVLIPRIAAVIFVDRIKARVPDPRARLAIFAVSAGLCGLGLAALNIVAAPVVGVEQLALMAIVAAGINSIAIVSMSPSLLSYLLYMVPNIASMAVAVLIGPRLEYRGVLLLLIVVNLVSLVVMATYVHLALRNSILLRLRVGESNAALQDSNVRLAAEVAEREAAQAALTQRNADLESANAQLAKAHSQLLQSEKLASVGQLAAGIAHEINNPIAFVHSNLHSLDTYTKDIFSLLDAYEQLERGAAVAGSVAQLKKAANMEFLRGDIPSLISESADGLARVEKIVRNLREFTHIDKAQWQFADLNLELDRTLSVAAHQLDAKADVVRDYGELPPVKCMPAQINQILLSLLVNAAQAIRVRGKITVRTWCADAARICISIVDTGSGIDPAHLSRIFDPFFTTKPVGEGTGLGLSMAYAIAQKHGGSIDVRSEPGQGATFTLTLPIVQDG